jgi:hypothetical protein
MLDLRQVPAASADMLEHSHTHVHDDHHQHTHGQDDPPGKPHTISTSTDQ